MITTIFAELEANFCPTEVQVADAIEYMEETGHLSVLVAVNFPGKQRGIWNEGQTRETVLDMGQPAIWVDRESALTAFDTGQYGNAMFRVYSDGHVHLVHEA